ncbi:MAG: lamin tail domain-containing protein [Thermoflexales bacterium]
MQSPFRARNWIIFLLINALVSAVTAFLVVQAFTQAASRPATTRMAAAATQPVAAADAAPSVAEGASILPAGEPPTAAQEDAAAEAATPLPQPAATTETVARATRGAIPSVRISAVIYPGQRTREAVVIVNEGDAVDLTGWTLATPRGKAYTFGNVVLFKESFINLHTTSGVDVPTDLFWNQPEAVWRVGDEVVLRRGDEVIATYIVR